MVTETKRELTYDDYLALPEIKQRYDIVDGEFILTPAPTLKHQTVIGNLYRVLYEFVSKGDLGFVFLSPHDIVVRRTPKLTTRQPDLTYVSKERKHVLGDRIEGGGPDLVIEILSPGDTRKRIEAKLKDYCVIGVMECWITSTSAKSVEVLRLSPSGFHTVGLYGSEEFIISEVLPGLDIPVKKIFD